MLISIGKLKTYLGEITGLVTIIIGFGMILANQAPGPWPKTTAVLVVLLSIGFLWGQWWPQIHRKSIILIVNPGKQHWLDGIFDLVRKPSRQSYALPLWQRRLQCAALFSLTIAAIVLVYPLFGGMIYEINPPDLPEVLESCEGDESVNSLRIIVAEFNELGNILIEDRIVDQLLDQTPWGSGVLVCKVNDVVKNRIEARQLGESNQAAIVVWGRSDEAIYEIHLEIAQWELPDHRIPTYPTPEASAPSFQMREPILVSFIVEYTLSQLLYVNGDTLNARNRLENAVKRVQSEGLIANSEYTKNFKDAYFMLGYFYDEETSDGFNTDKAIDYYSLAITVDNDFYPAYINRAIVYDSKGQIDLALADYNFVAERAQQTDPESAATAFINIAMIYVYSQPDRDRAESYFAEAQKLSPLEAAVEHGIASLYSWNNPEQAVEDFSTALALKPDDPYIYNHLGKAQLLSGQFDAAVGTYRMAIESANWQEGDVAELIRQLKSLASEVPDDPELQQVIGQIIRALRDAELP